MINGIIFDIDGILIDSEELHSEALFYAIKSELKMNVKIDIENLIGLSLDETIAKFGATDEQCEKIKILSTKYYLQNVKSDLVRPGVKELLTRLIERNIPFGCVSSAQLKICLANLNQLQLNGKKDFPIVGYESVTLTKPHPMPYLKMLDILKLDNSEVIVIEDSDTGITSAYEAGIRNIYAWPHKLSHTQKYEKAKRVIQSIDEIDF